MIIVLRFFFNPLSTVINIIIVSIIPYLKSLLFLMIINIFIICVVPKHSQKNNKKFRAQITMTMTMCGLIGKLPETTKGC